MFNFHFVLVITVQIDVTNLQLFTERKYCILANFNKHTDLNIKWYS